MPEACDFCGALDPFAWCHPYRWCSSDRCRLLHRWATVEPQFYPFFDPTPAQQLAGLLIYWPLWILIPLTDGAAIVYRANSWRGRLSIWVYSNSYFWHGRWKGII